MVDSGGRPVTVDGGASPAAVSDLPSAGSLADLLELEQVEPELFRTARPHADPYPLYGGQVAAQSLCAAAATVEPGSVPHSLHGSFLRAGVAAEPIDFRVLVDRAGRSFSARRVEARQDGRLLFTASASFQRGAEGPMVQVPAMPVVTPPESAPARRIPRLLSFETRAAEEDYPHGELPTRFWARCTAVLGADPVPAACAVLYLSDISSGIAPLDTDTHRSGVSLDHSMWFHRRAAVGDWLLVDMVPVTVAEGRGWYTGAVFGSDGALVASFGQEALYRPGGGRYFHLEPE